MSSRFLKRATMLAASIALSGAGAISVAAAGPVSVTVNGAAINLNPQPTERAGRVFVPLRGVFENLGATVVYENGTINATGRGHSISLRIGSQQATVDGQQQIVDVAPFIIGASTYVPLRFVSQALGATVNYDGSNNLVAINLNGGTTAVNPPSQTITPVPNGNNNRGNRDNNNGGSGLNLSTVVPARGVTVTARRPQIEALFENGTANPGSIRVFVDQLDVTANSTRSPNGIAYAPTSPLIPGRHNVRVTGNDSAGASFDRSWTFSSGSNAQTNSITNVQPPSGAQVPNRFAVSGHTSPNALVVVQVGVSETGQAQSQSSIGAILGALLGGSVGNAGPANNTQHEMTADGNGNFSTQVSLGSVPSGSELVLAIHSTDRQTGSAATPYRQTLRVQ